MDNGPPFGTTGLSVGWVKPGLRLAPIEPGRSGQMPPASLWQPSTRCGVVYLGAALTGEPVGLPSGAWLARCMASDLGVIDRRSGDFLPHAAARPGRRVGQERNEETVSHVSGQAKDTSSLALPPLAAGAPAQAVWQSGGGRATTAGQERGGGAWRIA